MPLRQVCAELENKAPVGEVVRLERQQGVINSGFAQNLNLARCGLLAAPVWLRRDAKHAWERARIGRGPNASLRAWQWLPPAQHAGVGLGLHVMHRGPTARWLWKSTRTKAGNAVPWEVQAVNTDSDNFVWEEGKVRPHMLLRILNSAFKRRSPFRPVRPSNARSRPQPPARLLFSCSLNLPASCRLVPAVKPQLRNPEGPAWKKQ